MSMGADINTAFDELLQKCPEWRQDILICKFGVFESLEWDERAGEVVRTMIDEGLTIDGNMHCYIDA